MADGCSSNLDNLLDLATKTESESWFLIDKLHLAPSSVLQIILKRLQTAVRTKGWFQYLLSISLVLFSLQQLLICHDIYCGYFNFYNIYHTLYCGLCTCGKLNTKTLQFICLLSMQLSLSC